MYKECPQRYKFRYIDRVPEKPKYYFAFGHSIHFALEFLYGVKSPPFPTLQELLKAFERDWKSKNYKEKGYLYQDREEADFQKGLDILARYYKKHESTFHVPLSVEFRTKLAIDGLNVTIVVDRIDYLGDGKIAIVDYKTGKSIVNNTDQLYLYQKILESTPSIRELITAKYGDFVDKVKVDKSVFYYLNSLTEKHHAHAGAAKIADFWQEVLKVATNIRDKKFDAKPTEKTCRYCDYKMQCPAFSGEDSRNLKTQIICDDTFPTAEKNHDILGSKTDRYLKMLSDLGKMESELNSLKNEIIMLMKEKKLTRNFTKKCEMSLVKSSQTRITDKQKLVDLLKNLNLLGKVLVPTKSGVEKLLTDDTIPAETKKKINKFFETVEHLELKCSKIEE
jgi:RecB family exonuclease